MQAKTSLEDFQALVRRAGLTLSPAQIVELHSGWAYIEPMLERIRAHGRGREADLALTFRPDMF